VEDRGATVAAIQHMVDVSGHLSARNPRPGTRTVCAMGDGTQEKVACPRFCHSISRRQSVSFGKAWRYRFSWSRTRRSGPGLSTLCLVFFGPDTVVEKSPTASAANLALERTAGSRSLAPAAQRCH
jgi:hypothetical protein